MLFPPKAMVDRLANRRGRMEEAAMKWIVPKTIVLPDGVTELLLHASWPSVVEWTGSSSLGLFGPKHIRLYVLYRQWSHMYTISV